ncbi:MAG TPA: sugar transferase [Gaiellaceae bacterium]|nr:sugar transferase [Gaiellaceae bacterium]
MTTLLQHERLPARGGGRPVARRFDDALKRGLDVSIAAVLLLVLLPLLVIVAAAIKLDSPGPLFFRARRVGFRGSELLMLKFRKMRDDADGPPLTTADDRRFTRVGRVLAATKLDELPQLWNVLRGEMSLVGPRPEDPEFVALEWDAYRTILEVRPGITGLCQLAFAREAEILDEHDRTGQYVERLLPQKARLDALYASRRSLAVDLRVLAWTVAAVLLRCEVAVNRRTGALSLRRRRRLSQPSFAAAERRRG